MQLKQTKLALGLMLGSMVYAPVVDAKTLTIAIDMSGSSPVLNQTFANTVAKFVGKKVLALKQGDTVRMRTFGSRFANNMNQTFTLGRRLRAKQLAPQVQLYLQSLPTITKTVHNETNIISYFEFEDGLDCSNHSEVIALTDAAESSEYVSESAFVQGKQKLPKPDVDLSACEVTFYGLGAGKSAKAAKYMRQEWQRFVTEAGGSFKAILY